MALSDLAKMEYHYRGVHLRELGFSSYDEYMNSLEWREIRRRVVKRDRRRCVLCSRKGNRMEVHHLSYSVAVLKGKRLSEIQLLCHWCHLKIEGSYGPNKRAPSEARRKFYRILNNRRKYTRLPRRSTSNV